MRRYFFRLFCGLIVILSLASITFGWAVNRSQVLTSLTWRILQEWHYSPRGLDDQFSQDTFALYLESLDPDKRFFTKADLEKLQEYEQAIDDEIQEGSSRLVELSSSLLSKRIQEVQAMAGEILAEPFDYFSDEDLEIDAKKRDYTNDTGELRELWRKMLKYQTILTYLDLAATGEEEVGRANLEVIDKEKEAQAREKVAKNLRSILERLLEDSREEAFHRYLNAVTKSFDPHTTYLTPEKKEDFDIEMRGTLEGIGALLQEEGEYIKIVEIIPGGAAWRQGELKPGDLILQVAQGEGEEAVDLYNMRVTEAVRYIRGKKGTEVRLTVKKPDGQIVTIPIIRDIVVLEESYARQALLSPARTGEETAKRFGYIYLPSFYRDFADLDGRSAAMDLRKILEQINGEEVDGVILDLRNNGGGSLDDALKIAGFFIHSGPLLQAKGREKTNAFWDSEKGVIYNGPLLVLVNSFTASGAEILAAALQDYDRAVIAGNRTFGKGSIQTILDLDHFLPLDLRGLKPLGSMKLTIQQFYRVTGEPIQYHGVVPDITLPDPYGYIEAGERTLKHTLPEERLASLNYSKWETPADLRMVQTKSSRRVAVNKSFQQINEYVEKVNKERLETRQSLHLAKIHRQQQKRKNELKQFEEAQASVEIFLEVSTLTGDNALPEEKLREWYDQIRKDVIIGEAVQILEDLLAASY
ncbi:MAG TPA: carboxy terminal-processing peptidase [Firmicutes bacterium]|jgi:carboxyl-terminal processing protease|nr:carboxy terminal-processing peptidase [Bacillota bacterium]